MICFDNVLLSDYLAGEPAAREFLEPYADELWCVSSIVLYEAMMGALYGHIDGPVDAVTSATAEFETADVSDRTARNAVQLQADLQEHGQQLEARDALIAGSAVEVGGRLATEDGTLRAAGETGLLDVLDYDRSH